MANANNVINVENILLTYAQPNTLERRQELISEIIQMFENDDTTAFQEFATTFPGNENGDHTATLVSALGKMEAEDQDVFQDYQQALTVAQNMMNEISKLPHESFQMFTGILSLRPNAKDVNGVFNLKTENPPLSNIQKFIMPEGQEAPKNFIDGPVLGFVRTKEKAFAREPSLKGRYYLRTILSEVSPGDAHNICANLFTNKTADPQAKAKASYDMSHESIRWAAMVVDRKKRHLLHLESIPVPQTAHNWIDKPQGRLVNLTSDVMNAGIVCSVMFALVASALPAKKDTRVTQGLQTIQKTVKPRP